jgi:hypothetical protein
MKCPKCKGTLYGVQCSRCSFNLQKLLKSNQCIFDYNLEKIIEHCLKELNDTQLAADFISKAENEKEHYFSLSILAEIYSKLYHDNDKARKFLNRATALLENGSNDYYSLCQLAELYMELLNDEETTEEIIKSAQKIAKGSLDFVNLAHAYMKLPGRELLVREMLDETEARMDESFDLYYLVKVYMNYFKDENKAKELLIKAEKWEEKNDYDDCEWIAELYMTFFAAEKKARELLERVENKPDYSLYDQCDLAKHYLTLFNDENKALELLKEAEEKAVYDFDFSHIAESYMELFKDEVKARTCLELALKDKHFFLIDYCITAIDFLRILGDYDKAVNILAAIEKEIDDEDDAVNVAFYNHEIGNDEAKDRILANYNCQEAYEKLLLQFKPKYW